MFEITAHPDICFLRLSNKLGQSEFPPFQDQFETEELKLRGFDGLFSGFVPWTAIMDFLEYADVSCEHRGSMVSWMCREIIHSTQKRIILWTFVWLRFQQSGKLKLTDEKVQFKPHAKSGKSDLIPPDQIEVVNWQRLAGSWGIRIFTKDGLLHRFAGFKEAVSP